MDSSLLPFVQVNVSWAAEHRWKPGDGVTALSVGQYALWLVLGGALVVQTADREHRLPAGTACLLPARVPRDIATPEDDGGRWLSVGFTASLFGRVDLLQGVAAPVEWQPEPADRQGLEQWMRRLADEWTEVVPPMPNASDDDPRRSLLGYPTQPRGPVSALIGDGLGRALFGLCWRVLDDKAVLQRTAQPDTPVWLRRTLEHIAREPGTPVSTLTGVAGLSPAQFRRAFHAWVGASPQTYVTRARLDEARRLLLTTDWVIQAVAERVGFTSLSYFTRLFTQQFGLSPARYRRLARQPGV